MKRNFLVLMVLALSVPVLAQTWSKELEKAAKKGDVTAQLAVGNAYFNGDGVNADKEKAAQWYNMAALANSAEGKAKLYSFHSKELEKLAKDDTEALYQLGCLYFDGNGIEKDIKKGLKFLNKARKQNHPKAFEKMGSTYTREFFVMAKDIAYYEGNCEGIYYLGLCILNGIGCTADAEIATELFEAAMKAGHKKSAEMFHKNYSEALLRHYQKLRGEGMGVISYYSNLGGTRLTQLYDKKSGYVTWIDENAKKVLFAKLDKESSYVVDSMEIKFKSGAIFKGSIDFGIANNHSITLQSGYVVVGNDTLRINEPIFWNWRDQLLGSYTTLLKKEEVKDSFCLRYPSYESPLVFDTKGWTKSTRITRIPNADLSPDADTLVTYYSGNSWINPSKKSFYIEAEDSFAVMSIDEKRHSSYDNGVVITGRFYNAKTGEQEKGNTYLFNMFYSNNGNIYNPGMFNGFNKDMAQKIFASTDGIMMQLKKPGNFILNDRSITHRKGLNEEQLKAMKDELFKQWAKEFVRNVEKKYGATQASLLRSQSKILTIKDIHKVNVLIKGLHIDVVKEILQVITEEDQAATYLSHHRTYDDGTSVYYLESVFNGTIARIWFKNNYITNWTIY
jgi:TPR repeat protein